MAVRPITKLGDPILRTVSRKVETSEIASPEVDDLIRDMIDTMFDARGIGIAAPQVGVGLQVAIINERNHPYPIINPRIIKHSLRSSEDEEGCLSIPAVFGMVRRPREVTVMYVDAKGKQHRKKVTGLLARVFQHEIDHLNGILFIDRAKTVTEKSRP